MLHNLHTSVFLCFLAFPSIFFSSVYAAAIPSNGTLSKRTLTHPSAKHSISLFHGTPKLADAKVIVASGLELEKAAMAGDFHQNPVRAGYLTDSIFSAAQFACYPWNFKGTQASAKDTKVYVVEFSWAGDSSVEEFPDPSKDWEAFQDYNLGMSPTKPADYDTIMKKTMVTGPMIAPTGADKFYTSLFWQYAILGQKQGAKYVYSSKLKPETVHQVLCGHVPMGNGLDAAIYASGQKSSASFASVLTQINTPL